jgi:uncharacterized membrane protein YhaH (DUF805 family)
MQRKRAPYWLTATLLIAAIAAFFYLACLIASNASALVAVMLFALAMVVFYAAELRS